VGPRVVVQEDAFSEHPVHLFGSTSGVYSASHNKPLTLLWVPGAMNSVKKIPLPSFCVKKTNHITYLKAGDSGDVSVHVSSVITPTLRRENI
jgi:hypothetical protein